MADRIPQHFLDELLSRVDIVDVVGRRVPLKKSGKDYAARCPFHDERTPSFNVVPGKQFYHCFGCGASGTAITFLMEFDHLAFREAVEELASQVGLEIPAADDDRRRDDGQPLLDELAAAARFYRTQLREHPHGPAAIRYLKERGLSGAIAARFELGYAPDGWDNLVRFAGSDRDRLARMEKSGLIAARREGGWYDRFRNRIVFPIQDQRGRVVAFGGRILDSGEPKYLNSPETAVFHKGAELYGLFQARGPIRDSGRVLVVEGYLDVVALAQFGIDNVVATLGTATTRSHLQRLFRLAPEVVFCFDGDQAGRTAAWRALETALPELHGGRQVSFLFLPEGEDPDSLVRGRGGDEFRRLSGEATSLPEVLFERLSGQVDLERLDGRARLVELALPLIRQTPAGPLRELLEERLREISGVRHLDVPARAPATAARVAGAGAPARLRGAADRRLSAVATVISLLVQQPRLAAVAGEFPDLFRLEAPGMDLMAAAMDVARAHPDIGSAALVERFRGSEHHRNLEKLAAWDHKVPGDELEIFFRDALSRLDARRLRQEIDQLRGRGDLPIEERRRLASLLSAHQRLLEK
jgi:DNA primase